MIILIISLILDLFLNYFYPDINALMFVSGMIIYLIKKDRRLVFISAVLYDIFFGRIYFLYLFNFYIISKEITYLTNKLNKCFFTYIVIFICSLISFIILKTSILYILGYNYLGFNLERIIVLFLVNIIYSLIIYFILGIKIKHN